MYYVNIRLRSRFKNKAKQTQFKPNLNPIYFSAKMNENLFATKVYENVTAFRRAENKPNQTQFAGLDGFSLTLPAKFNRIIHIYRR